MRQEYKKYLQLIEKHPKTIIVFENIKDGKVFTFDESAILIKSAEIPISLMDKDYCTAHINKNAYSFGIILSVKFQEWYLRSLIKLGYRVAICGTDFNFNLENNETNI